MEAVNHQTAGKSAKAVCSLPGKLMSPRMVFNGPVFTHRRVLVLPRRIGVEDWILAALGKVRVALGYLDQVLNAHGRRTSAFLPLISLALARISFSPIRNSLVARIASPSPRRSHAISRARNPAATGGRGAVSQSWLRVISSFDLYHQSERPGEQARRQQGSRHGDEPRLEGAGCVAQPSHQIGSGTPGRAD